MAKRFIAIKRILNYLLYIISAITFSMLAYFMVQFFIEEGCRDGDQDPECASRYRNMD